LINALAKRYASALADITLAQFSADRAKADLQAFVEAFDEVGDLRNFLDSPAVGRDLKHKVLNELAAKMQLDPAVRNFILLIVDHRRAESLRDIQQAFREELNARLGIAEAEIISAHPLTVGEKDQLTAALARRTGKKIEARFREDKSLLGGAVVRVGSTVYDGSVREQLVRMREQLEAE
jgi:F-type H+-transporting ATPase subunit delta